MSLITFNINKNHIFFLLLFLAYFLRKLLGVFKKNLNKDKKIIFGNSQVLKRRLLDLYILTPSNLFAILLYCIIKRRAKKNSQDIKVIEKVVNKKLVFKERTLVEFGKLFKLTLLTATFNFIPRLLANLLFYIVNDDSKFDFSSLSSVNIVMILTISILSRIFLSSYYYRHHFVSLAINLFF